MKTILKQLAPPALVKLFRQSNSRSIRFTGNYETWEDAKSHSNGYNATEILRRVTAATRKVIAGDASFERDSVCFNEPDYRWPLLASLMWVASQQCGELDVIDFGGSLGSSYLQNRPFLSSLRKVRWRVVEQDDFVQQGRALFPDGTPEFHAKVQECVAPGRPQLLLLSSVLQYLPAPHEMMTSLLANQFPYIIIDRTTFAKDGQRERLTVQTVPPSIYKASYPCWFLSPDRLLNRLAAEYRLIAELPCADTATSHGGELRGFLFALSKQ